MPDPDWRIHAACRGADRNLFFAERGDVRHLAAARAICETCPVCAACADYALGLRPGTDTHGIFGGLTVEQRHRMRRRKVGAP